MMTASLVAAYVAAAILVAIFAYRYGSEPRPGARYMDLGHTVVVAATAALVGALWVLFVPTLIANKLRQSPARRPSVKHLERFGVRSSAGRELNGMPKLNRV
jgi:heme/copper-type cytochrome/quinol oxidase subunit 2